MFFVDGGGNHGPHQPGLPRQFDAEQRRFFTIQAEAARCILPGSQEREKEILALVERLSILGGGS